MDFTAEKKEKLYEEVAAIYNDLQRRSESLSSLFLLVPLHKLLLDPTDPTTDVTFDSMARLAERIYTIARDSVAVKDHSDLAFRVSGAMWGLGLLAPGKDSKDLDAEIWNLVFPGEGL